MLEAIKFSVKKGDEEVIIVSILRGKKDKVR